MGDMTKIISRYESFYFKITTYQNTVTFAGNKVVTMKKFIMPLKFNKYTFYTTQYNTIQVKGSSLLRTS